MQELTPLNETLESIPPSNIGELKTLSKYLIETESTLSAFWLFTPTFKAIILDGKFVKVNPATKEYFGYEMEEMLGQPYEQYIHPDDLKATRAKVIDLQNGEILKNFRNRYRHKNGSWVYLEWFGRLDQHSGIIFVSALNRTKEALQELEISRHIENQKNELDRFKKALDLSPVGIFLTDKNGLCIYVNRTYAYLTGLSIKDCIGTGWEYGVCESDRVRVTNAWYEYAEKNKEISALNPFEINSCTHNIITDIKTKVMVKAYFYDSETSIGYLTIIPS